tara:strand:+ start:5185 stop:6612 length:1428 start_codon:yes stop_codon:yes gene_type:complete
MEKTKINADLIKKYHQDLVYNYSEYPTKDYWNYEFKDKEYKDSLADWLPKNKNEPILFYVHTPFCEQLCYFCTCSKYITGNYENVKNYLYKYLFKEIDLLFNFLEEKKIKLNVKEIYFGGGSPTYYKPDDFKKLVEKLKSKFDFSNLGDFTVEIDPRRVDEDRLLFYSTCGVNRLSFGVQEFDLNVQKRINRVQPAELFHKILTKRVKEKFKTFNFDLLIGLPGQTNESMEKTMDKLIEIKPPQVQPMLLAYKPWVAKYQIKMVKEGPLPDFFDRKQLFKIATEKLSQAGYKRAGFETFVLPNDPIDKAMKEKKAYYNSLGVQKGAATNFVAVGSSAKGSLGDDYYSHNYYSMNLYQKSLDEGKLPVYRGIKLSKDDKIRKHLMNDLRTYFKIEFKEIENIFKINFKEYFDTELKSLTEHVKDKLVLMSPQYVEITELGRHFAPQIANVFDKYDPPSNSYSKRLEKINSVAVHPS